jgi:hypothetical protein
MLTVMIIGVTVTALMSSLGNAGNAGNIQRNSVQTDVVMRNYAEATKFAAQACVPGGSYTVTYTPPAGFTVATSPATTSCPAVASTAVLTLNVSAPLGAHQTMQIRIRTP